MKMWNVDSLNKTATNSRLPKFCYAYYVAWIKRNEAKWETTLQQTSVNAISMGVDKFYPNHLLRYSFTFALFYGLLIKYERTFLRTFNRLFTKLRINTAWPSIAPENGNVWQWNGRSLLELKLSFHDFQFIMSINGFSDESELESKLTDFLWTDFIVGGSTQYHVHWNISLVCNFT